MDVFCLETLSAFDCSTLVLIHFVDWKRKKEKNRIFLLNRYAGHVHQLRFRHGHTYGEETHLVSKEFPRLKRVKSEIVVSKQPNPYETREFPDGLIPGYAGNGKTFIFIFFFIRMCHQDTFLNDKMNSEVDIVLKQMPVNRKLKQPMKKDDRRPKIYNVWSVHILKQKV